MRTRSRTIVVAGLIVAGTVGLIWGVVFLASPREPSYQGKTLSEWIVPFCRQTAKGLDAPGGPQHFEELEPVRGAVREMGSNAVPFLIAKLNHRESGLHREARQLLEKQPIVGLRLSDPNVSKVRAIRALANLGPAAEPAIPSLKAQVSNAVLSQHAVYALSGISVEGMRALVEQYTNVPTALRMQIAMTIISPASIYRGEIAKDQPPNEIPFDVWIEGLSRIALDATSVFRIPAIYRLGMYGRLASNAVPVLLPMVSDRNPVLRQTAIRALGHIRSQPEVVVPAVTGLLNDPDLGTQMAAEEALRAFGYNVPFRTQVPRVIHPPPPGQTKERYF